MIFFDRIIKTANKLADLILRDEHIQRGDIDSSLLDSLDKDYVIDNLLDSEKVKSRNQLEKELNKTKAQDWQKIKSVVHPQDTKVRYLTLMGKIAAIFIGLLAISYFVYRDQLFIKDTNSIANAYQDRITLKLSNGTVKVLSGNISETIRDKNGELISVKRNNRLKYANTNQSNAVKNNSSEIAYHELKVPYGRTFEVELSDGTNVHLNAGSSLKYPTTFANRGNRHVFLEGEAFFEVAKDEHHPFIVATNDINVRVLGTKFVVDSYKEETQINTVLLEGSVALFKKEEKYDPKKSSLLTPGNKATWDKEKQKISYKAVNTKLYTGWINGEIIFNHMPFSEIIRKLERHYNVTITNNDRQLSDEIFTASFEKEPIEDVLLAFSKNYTFEYTMINNRNIIINPQKSLK